MNNIQTGQQATLVIQVTDARLYKMIKNQRSRLQNGYLSLCWLDSSKSYFISIGDFCTNIYPNTPFVVLQSQKGISLLFPDIVEGLNGIYIPGDQAQLFISNLSQIIQVIPFQNAINIPMFKTTIDLHCQDIITNPLENDIEVIGLIQQGGESAKKGFIWMGGKLAQGISAGGQYLGSKIEKQENVQVSQDTKIKVAMAKQVTSQTIDVTGQYLSQLFKPVAEAANDLKKEVNKKIDNSNSQAAKDGRQVALATWDSLGVAVGGLGSALSQVGDSIGTNSKQVVDKKYGQDVSQTFYDNPYNQIQYQNINK